MIPHDSKPGTLIICTDDETRTFGVTRHPHDPDLGGLRKHRVYTVERITEYPKTLNGYIVKVKEIGMRRENDWGFDIGRFKLAVLPESITGMLEVE